MTAMLPFERLRSLARSSVDDRDLVEETAECLADFRADPVQLVLVCRQLLAHQPVNGPLWWLCARVVGASDAAVAAHDSLRAMARDRTAARLADALPFPHDAPIAVLGWPAVTAEALGQRTDLDVVVVRPERAGGSLRRRPEQATRSVRMANVAEAMAAEPSHLLVEVVMTSPTDAIVPSGAGALRDALPDAGFWLVSPVERIVPTSICAAAAERLDDTAPYEVVRVADADRVAGPGGLESPERLVTRLDCPVAPELLRR
jgi:hypothetical protein